MKVNIKQNDPKQNNVIWIYIHIWIFNIAVGTGEADFN